MKITYAYKETGNVAIDDVTIVYGDFANVPHSQKRVGQVTSAIVEELSPLTEYHYQVRAICEDVVSQWSPEQVVTTTDVSQLTEVRESMPKVYAVGGVLTVAGLSGLGQVSVYNLSGQLLFSESVGNRSEVVIDTDKGIYLVRVIDNNRIYNFKVCM